MKKIILLILGGLMMVACGSKTAENKEVATDEESDKTCVEILYFHGDMRCRNCVAMEKGVTELLEDQFKEEVNEGKIVFKTIDITTPEGEKIADNYNVSWSSLYLNNWKDGKEERNDLTRMGMQTAAKDPAAFKEEIKSRIDNYLN